jgi:dephospho-CoA kinase
MSDFIIGLTGGVASGKSEVTRRFEALGVSVADADLVARAVVEPGQPALAAIAARFGTGILLADGGLDRRRLRERVFADAQARRELEAITHPAIRLLLREQCSAAPGPYAIAAIPLLAEAGGRAGYPWLDRILVVDAPLELQLARLMRRDAVDETLALRMIAVQAPREARLAIADDVVVNDGQPEHLDARVAALDAQYRAMAS